MRRGTGWLWALAVALVSCTAAPDRISTTTTEPLADTTTTAEDLCPDVFCVVLRLDPEAFWSDGTPVSAADFAHTLELARSAAGPHPGYDLVTGLEEGAGGEVIIAFSQVTGAFLTLFQPVLPAHEPGVTSSAFSLDGERLESDRATVELVAVDGVRGSVTGLRTGEIDMVWLTDPPTWAAGELAGIEGVTTAVGPGPDWEMVSFNQANPLLAEDWVRRAIAMTLDRDAMADATVLTVAPEAEVLDSGLVGVETEPYPIPHDPTGARSLLEANGCISGDDGILSCGGIRMSFGWVTTTGDPWRLTIAELAQESLGAVGIEIAITTMVPAEFFAAEHLFGEGWDIAAFAWTAQRDPVESSDLYRCEGAGPHGFGALNIGRHCGDDDLITAAQASFDTTERVDLMRRIDREFVSAAAMVPLFSRPIVAAWVDGVEGVEPAPFAGPLDRVGDWSGTTRLAAAMTPQAVGLLTHRGAFRAMPGGKYLPDLVTEFETIGG